MWPIVAARIAYSRMKPSRFCALRATMRADLNKGCQTGTLLACQLSLKKGHNYHQIVKLNEIGLLPESGVTDLEAGANRCAIS